MDESAKEKVWVLLSDLFVDTVHTERELTAIGAALKGTGCSADDVEKILRKEVAPVCGRWMRYPTIGPWPMWDPEDVKQRVRAYLNRPWYKPRLMGMGLFGLSDVERSWEIVRHAMEN
jgi:hypothetical protein